MKIPKFINLPVTLISVFLISIGILVIYSSSKELALQQLLFTIAGFTFFFTISRFQLGLLRSIVKPLYILTCILLLITLILGFETRGTMRWIPLGIINIQPSEFAKPILILMLANFWSENYPNWLNIFKSFLWGFPYFFLVFRQPDLGSALTLGAIWLGMLYASRISVKKIIILFLIFIITLPTGWVFLHGYQKERILSFLDPGSDPLGRGYNVIQSEIAVGSGEFLGRGLGRGTQSRLQFLPEFRTDFIFASIAEELGFVGSSIILLLYLSLFSYSILVARCANNSFGFLTVMGVLSMLMFQVLVNIGMNIGLLPITGITLPLISYGGSSLIATLISLGFVAATDKSPARPKV